MRARASGPVSRRSSTRRAVTSSRWSRRYGMMMSRSEMLLSLTCFQYMTLLTYLHIFPIMLPHPVTTLLCPDWTGLDSVSGSSAGLDWIRISGSWIWTGLDLFNSIHFILWLLPR